MTTCVFIDAENVSFKKLSIITKDIVSSCDNVIQ